MNKTYEILEDRVQFLDREELVFFMIFFLQCANLYRVIYRQNIVTQQIQIFRRGFQSKLLL